ncbi:DNA-binding transcriptional regulator, AcrR family [Nonomuraea solani]|uniref:DNA-binding transcriptional regulator, AcrR family n=1 Tax=Nonomuraea solani TaxID=1144553 RepID=A0A1H6EDD8_9ACTN|nr:TetR/AcrR family transcriptional regulator [Nonomuraea solani]SEG95820.1 DNA-binding transcriptional regulator, AcrR family [Nonomuraea solani]
MSAAKPGDAPARQRILHAAFSAFTEAGYSQTSTLEIAKRARVSKRELYALVGNKQELLAACIRERAQRLQAPAGLPEPHDRQSLEHALVTLGTRLLSETTHPTVIAVYRLAIAEAVRAPEVAHALDSLGRQSGRAAVTAIMVKAQERGLLSGTASQLAEQFAALLWGDLMISLLLRTVDPPDSSGIARQARGAAAAFLRLHPDGTPASAAETPFPRAGA